MVRPDSMGQGLSLLRTEHFDGIYADVQDPAIRDKAGHFLQADRILKSLDEGVAMIDPHLRIIWANATFEGWCQGPACGRGFYEALDSPETLGPDYSPFYTALAGKGVTTRLHCRDNRYLELHVTPVHDSSGRVSQMISLCRDVTAEVHQQQKLDALHQAGGELAALVPDQLADMSVEERIELLKLNIRRFIHDLLHYDVIEIRLLDRQTGRLEPLLEEGMTPEAAQRTLHPSPEGNGVTGFVAATGKSYLCPDAATDPLYIEGRLGGPLLLDGSPSFPGPGDRHFQCREPPAQRLRRARSAVRRDLQPRDRRRPAHPGAADGGEAQHRLAIDRGHQPRGRAAGG